jgi:hypothetical protein
MAFTYLTGRVGDGLRSPAGTRVYGRVRLTPTAVMHNGTVTIGPAEYSVGLDGALDGPVAATDDAGTTPTGVAYLVEILPRTGDARRFYAEVPADSAGGEVDLDALEELADAPTLSATHTIRAAADYDDTVDPEEGQAIVWDGAKYAPADVAAEAGVTDHGALTGLSDDDHPQYLTTARGDARYYTESEVDAALAGKQAAGSYATAAALASHEADTTSIHGIADTSALETTTGSAAKVAAHAAASDPHGDRAVAATALAAHEADTTNVHGITDTSVLLTTTAAPELIRDTIAAALVAGSNITITPNDGADTITIAATGGGAVSSVNGQTGAVVAGAQFPRSGSYIAPLTVVATGAPNAGEVRAMYVDLAAACTADRIGVRVTTAVASSTVTLMIYSHDPTTGFPGALLLNAGTIDSSTTGAKEITISQALPAGRIWLAGMSLGGAPTLQIGNGNSMLPALAQSEMATAMVAALRTGLSAAPDPLAATATTQSGPRVYVRIA